MSEERRMRFGLEMPGSCSYARFWNPKFSSPDIPILPVGVQLDSIVFGCQICTLSGELLMVLVVPHSCAEEDLFVESGHLNLAIQLATEVRNNFHQSMGYISRKASVQFFSRFKPDQEKVPKMIAVLISLLRIDVEALRS